MPPNVELNSVLIADEKLHVGSIKIQKTLLLKREIKHAIQGIKQKKNLKKFSQELGVTYSTLWRYLSKNESIPLLMQINGTYLWA